LEPTRPRGSGLDCRHFGICGGCSDLHVAPAASLERKLASLHDLLAPWLGGVHIETSSLPESAEGYRTRLLYPAQPQDRGQALLGLYARRTHDIVPIAECRIQHPALTALGPRVQRVIRELGLTAWDERALRGDVRALSARIAAGSGELMIGVVTRAGPFPRGAELAERIVQAAEDLPVDRGPRIRLVGVVRNLNESSGNALIGAEQTLLHGREWQMDEQDDLRFRIGFGSFYQLHRDASALLYAPALEMLGDVTGAHVLDGYGGIGTFGLRLARRGAASVRIVEASPTACRDAEHNVRDNELSQIQVESAPFAKAALAPRPDVLIVDPPRAGLMDAGVARVVALRPERLLHVACSPKSLARDLVGLTAAGYRVRAVKAVDLFPFTEHIEVLALLER